MEVLKRNFYLSSNDLKFLYNNMKLSCLRIFLELVNSELTMQYDKFSVFNDKSVTEVSKSVLKDIGHLTKELKAGNITFETIFQLMEEGSDGFPDYLIHKIVFNSTKGVTKKSKMDCEYLIGRVNLALERALQQTKVEFKLTDLYPTVESCDSKFQIQINNTEDHIVLGYTHVLDNVWDFYYSLYKFLEEVSYLLNTDNFTKTFFICLYDKLDKTKVTCFLPDYFTDTACEYLSIYTNMLKNNRTLSYIRKKGYDKNIIFHRNKLAKTVLSCAGYDLDYQIVCLLSNLVTHEDIEALPSTLPFIHTKHIEALQLIGSDRKVKCPEKYIEGVLSNPCASIVAQAQVSVYLSLPPTEENVVHVNSFVEYFIPKLGIAVKQGLVEESRLQSMIMSNLTQYVQQVKHLANIEAYRDKCPDLFKLIM